MTQTSSRHSLFPPGTDLASGDTLHLILVWKPLQALTSGISYSSTWWMRRPSVGPVGWRASPQHRSHRPVGQRVEDHEQLALPEDSPGGAYSALVGLYDGAAGERAGNQAVRVAEITVR